MPASVKGLGLIGVAAIISATFWFGLSLSGLIVGGIGIWFIVPVGLVGGGISVAVAIWAFQRRTQQDPALILDDAGLYDNVSPVKAGRVKWSETDRMWVFGFRGLRFLCVLPDPLPPFYQQFEDLRPVVMKLNHALFGAPIVIPTLALEIDADDLWHRIGQMAGAARRQASPPSVLAGT